MASTEWCPLRDVEQNSNGIVELAYRNESHTCLVTVPVHLPLFLAIKQVIMILHAHELGPAMLLGTELHHSELIRPHAARTDVPDLTTSYQIIERLHGLLDRGIMIKAMDLE